MLEQPRSPLAPGPSNLDSNGSKQDFFEHTFARLNRVLKEGVLLKVTDVLVDRDRAAVELRALSTQNNGRPFDNCFCWICRFEGEMIVEVRAYLDSALVQQAIDDNAG